MQAKPTSTAAIPLRFFSASSERRPEAATDDGVVRGIDAVRACGNAHGLVDTHLPILAGVAQREKVAFGVRPVNRLATQLIRLGYPTKGLSIKGKSADWGPMAGLIPVSQRFSKLAGAPEQIERSNQQVQDCIRKRHATSVPLCLGTARLKTLVEKGVIRIEGTLGREDIQMFAEKNGRQHVFVGHLTTVDGVADYAISSEGAPVNVLATIGTARQASRPMTADYDLLLFAVPIEEFGSEDTYRPSPVGASRFKSLVRQVAKKLHDAAYAEGLSGAANQIDRDNSQSPRVADYTVASLLDHGVSSPRMDAFILRINHALGRTDADRLVQHSADTHNPYTSPEDNYPSVIFVARKEQASAEVLMVKNKEAAIKVYGELKESGFQFFGNDHWADEMPPESYRRASFSEAKEAIESEVKSPMASEALARKFGS